MVLSWKAVRGGGEGEGSGADSLGLNQGQPRRCEMQHGNTDGNVITTMHGIYHMGGRLIG